LIRSERDDRSEKNAMASGAPPPPSCFSPSSRSSEDSSARGWRPVSDVASAGTKEYADLLAHGSGPGTPTTFARRSWSYASIHGMLATPRTRTANFLEEPNDYDLMTGRSSAVRYLRRLGDHHLEAERERSRSSRRSRAPRRPPRHPRGDIIDRVEGQPIDDLPVDASSRS